MKWNHSKLMNFNLFSFYCLNVKYIILSKLFRKKLPFIGGIVINEKCNLNCIHCSVANRNIPDLTFEEVKDGLRRLYAMGLSYLYANKKLFQCCRAIGNDEVCKHCGYLGLVEIYHITRLNPNAIYSAFKYL
ncbi:MAG: hypothetical protein U9N08_04190 [Candidatus Caldatribacteriota bacterium]|nr:hypothetical protein [Candidatus Caldatribacteriota bacterium]